MSIRRKILISNIILICVPVLLAVLLCAGYIRLSGSALINPLGKGNEGTGSLSHTQEALYLYEAEIAKINWENITDDSAADPDTIPTADQLILAELSDMGYRLRVSTENRMIFDSLYDTDITLLEAYSAGSVDAYGSLLRFSDKTVITDTFEKNGISYAVTAVHDESGADQGTLRSMVPIYMISPTALLIFLMIILSATVLTGFVLSHWLGHSILLPLDTLRSGAKQISSGNLDFQMDAGTTDEFGDVCADFEVMRQKLKEAERERISYEARRKELLSGVSHDLRSPLTSIKGYTMGLKDGIADTEEKKNRYYEAILTRTNDMERLLKSLSELVRLENAGTRLHMERVSLDNFLLQFLKEQEAYLDAQHVTVTYDSHLGDFQADIDSSEMCRVFMNLVENTVKYRTRPDSNVRIDASVSEAESVAILRFCDDGPGVEEKDLPHLFDSFYRADASRTKPENGSGLGLAIVREIIAGHGGSATAYPGDNGGLEIRITLPIPKKGDAR